MLVLTRKIGERIHIGNGIVVTVTAIHGQRVRIGVEAPPSIAVRREEVGREAGTLNRAATNF